MDILDKQVNLLIKKMYGDGCRNHNNIRGTGLFSTLLLGIFGIVVISVSIKGILGAYQAINAVDDLSDKIQHALGVKENCKTRIITNVIIYHTINLLIALFVFSYYKNMAYYCHGARGFFTSIVLIIVYYFFMKVIEYSLDKLLYSDLIFEKPCDEFIVPKTITRTYDSISSGFDMMTSKIESLF